MTNHVKLRIAASAWGIGFFLSMPHDDTIAAALPCAGEIVPQAEEIPVNAASTNGPGFAILVAHGDELVRGWRNRSLPWRSH